MAIMVLHDSRMWGVDMLGKRLADKLIQLIHDKSNDLEYMFGEFQLHTKVQNDAVNAKLDVIEALLQQLVAMDTIAEEKPSEHFVDDMGLYSYKAHEKKMHDFYDRPKDRRSEW